VPGGLDLNNSQLINQDSGNFEYYTPIEIVNAAREVMGSIDLDPFSSEEANRKIKAAVYFSKEIDGLSKCWFGSVWMNHPFSRKMNNKCIVRLMEEYFHQNINQACCITFAATSEKWFNPLMDFPQCFLSPRTNYYLPDGTKKRGVTKGSVVTYLGKNVDKFIEVFDGHFGTVKI
jgi:hypothetical protein